MSVLRRFKKQAASLEKMDRFLSDDESLQLRDSLLFILAQLPFPALLLDSTGAILGMSKSAQKKLIELNGTEVSNGARFGEFLEPPKNDSLKFSLTKTSSFFEEVTWRGRPHKEPMRLDFIYSSPCWFVTWREPEASLVEELRQRFEKSAPLISVGEMAGSIAHEINNPLTILLWQAGRLKMLSDRGKLDSGIVDKISLEIEQTVSRIVRIVKTLKTALHGHEGQKLEKMDIGQLIDEIYELSLARLNKLEIEWRHHQWVGPLVVMAQPTALSQVLLNLVSNSCDALEQSRADRWIDIKFVERGSQLEIQFSDSGQGIPPEVYSRLFEPFVTTKPPGKGTGLGLGLCRKYMQNQGGDFRYNHLSPNTQFILILRRI